MTPTEFGAAFDVSRETLDRLETYRTLIAKWNPRINLVSARTLEDFWQRHAADSAQLFDLAGEPQTWADLGSGGGFPGLVVATIAAEKRSALRVTLIESDQRKCAFLRSVAQALDLDVDVRPDRIEALKPFAADVVSARALAPLTRLLAYARPFCHEGTRLLFPKGRTAECELTEAKAHWHIQARLHPSRTDPEARIVEVIDYRPLS